MSKIANEEETEDLDDSASRVFVKSFYESLRSFIQIVQDFKFGVRVGPVQNSVFYSFPGIIYGSAEDR